MADVFDYLIWRGDLTLENSPFNEIDGVVLSLFSYLPFEKVFEKDEKLSVSIAEIADRFFVKNAGKSYIFNKNDERLLMELSKSERFSGIKVIDFGSQRQLETETQFSAVTLQLANKMFAVVFRGTDNTLVGWKEDFNMSFECPVPSQTLSVEYMNKTAKNLDGDIIVAGHSKGGNLAVYAAVFAEDSIQNKITEIYNYDGPGFQESVLQTEKYKKICAKTMTFVPQSSIVGMMLGHEEKYTIVHSTEKSQLWQHSSYSWEVERNHFVCLETVTNSSRFVDFTLKYWLASLTKEQREKTIDAVYYAAVQTNVSTLREMGLNKFTNTKIVVKSIKNLDDETRKLVTHTLRLLMHSAKKSAIMLIQNKQE